MRSLTLLFVLLTLAAPPAWAQSNKPLPPVFRHGDAKWQSLSSARLPAGHWSLQPRYRLGVAVAEMEQELLGGVTPEMRFIFKQEGVRRVDLKNWQTTPQRYEVPRGCRSLECVILCPTSGDYGPESMHQWAQENEHIVSVGPIGDRSQRVEIAVEKARGRLVTPIPITVTPPTLLEFKPQRDVLTFNYIGGRRAEFVEAP